MADESGISKLWNKFSDPRGMQGSGNSVLPDNTKDSFNYDPRAPKENNSDSINKLRGLINPLIASLVEKSTKNLPNYNPVGEGTPSSVLTLPKVPQQGNITKPTQDNTVTENPVTEPTPTQQENVSPVTQPSNNQDNSSTETPTETNQPETATPPKTEEEKKPSTLAEIASGVVGAIAGAVAGDISFGNPFSNSESNVGSLSSGGSSISSALNSNPSGGDSGTVGESRFGGDDIQGKSVIEVLSRIYKVLSQTNSTVDKIARDTATLSKSQAKQDVSLDLQAANMRARQNEQSNGNQTSTPVFAREDNSKTNSTSSDDDDSEESTSEKENKPAETKKEKSTAKKVEEPPLKKLEESTAKKVEEPLTKKSGLKDAFTGPRAKKVAGGGGAAMGAAGALLSGNAQANDGGMTNVNYNPDAEPQKNIGTNVGDIPASQPQRNIGTNVGDIAASQPEFEANKKAMEPMFKSHMTTNISNTKIQEESGKPTISESSTSTITSNSQSNPIVPTDRDSQLKQESEELYKNRDKYTVDELNAKFGEIARERNNIEYDRINKENPSPELPKAPEQERLPYVLSDKGDGKFAKIDIWTRKKTTATPEEISKWQEQNDRDNGKVKPKEEQQPEQQHFAVYKDEAGYIEKEDLQTGEIFNGTEEELKNSKDGILSTNTATPVTPYNYQSQMTESKNSGLSDLEKEKKAKLEAIGARRGKEGEDDAALDAEGEKVMAEFDEKKKSLPTATKITDSDGLTKQEHNEADAYRDKVENSGLYKKMEPSKFGKPTEAGFAMVDEVGRIDKRSSELDEELKQQGLHTAYSDKESMDKDLHRLDEIYAERDKLNNRRNDITATDEWRDAAHAKKSGVTQPVQTAQSAQQTLPPKPTQDRAGVGISVPNVRNNDSTIRMMEQGSMWSTQGGLMA